MERQMEHTGKWILGIHMAKGLKSSLFSELKGFCQLFIQREFFECLHEIGSIFISILQSRLQTILR